MGSIGWRLLLLLLRALVVAGSLLWVPGQGQPRDYCFITLSTKKPKYLKKNQAVALLNVSELVTEVWFGVFVVCADEQSRKHITS